MKKGILLFMLSLALGLTPGMALPLAVSVGAATPTFTGDVTADFTGSGILTIPDPGGLGDVGVPGGAPNGTVSGWDMLDLRLTYDAGTDTLYVGINTYGIAGDADGDGDPSHTSAWLNATQGTDVADLGASETAAVYFDLDKDGTWDVIAGISGSTDYSGFSVNNFAYLPFPPYFSPPYNFGGQLSGHIGTISPNPDAAHPDLEFTILNFSTLPGSDSSVGGFRVGAYMGSFDDDGIGEDSFQYEQNPHTIATIVSSAATVASGGSVSLDVTETNPVNPHSVDVTSPQVAVTKNGVALAALSKASPYYASGDTNGNGILNPGETWTWNNIDSGPVTGTTTFVARGSGTAPGDFPVDYQTDPLEQVEVTVDTLLIVGWETYPIDKVRVLMPRIALLAAIMVGASLLVLRHRPAQN